MTRSVHGYELQRVIGRGGMATVYLARQPGLNRLVALKELGGLRAPDPSYAQRFVREARVVGSLSHPNVVTVHDFFEQDAVPYIAMEYVPGGTLRPHMAAPSLAEMAGVLENVLAGLAHAELHGIVHRDLKPENLMVTSDGHVKIADFGIAKATGALQTGSFRTETGTTFGTPAYIAPEQAIGAEVGPWSDLYSLGVITFEMLVGRTPFYDSETPVAMALRHVNEDIPTVSDLSPDVDPLVSQWVERMLAKDPSQRTQSASDAWDEFEDIVIELLGPRWRDGSALVAEPQSQSMELLPTGRTRGMSGTRTGRLTGTGTGAMRGTRTGVMTGEVTVGPAATSAPTTRAGGRRKPVAVLAAMTFLAIAAGAAAFAGGGAAGGQRAAAAPERAAAAPAPAPAPAPAAPVAATPTPAPPDPAAGVLADLSRTVAPHQAALAAATSAKEQARAAADLAADYEGAADTLAGGSHPDVVAALRHVGSGYRRLAAAARRGDAAGYRAAAADVGAGRQRLASASAGVSGAAPVAPAAPATQRPAVSGGSNGSDGSDGSTGSSSDSGGSGGSGGADENENEPDENDNGD
jgi:hypothetical protein